MPVKSEAQWGYLWANNPALAHRWARKYGKPKNLPERVGEEPKNQKPAIKAAATKGEGSPMPLTFEEKIIDTFQATAAALEKAEHADLEKQAMEKEVANLIPEAVDACIRGGRVDAEDREKLAKSLQDPRKALRILTKVATHRNVEEASHLGGQVDQSGRSASGQANGRTKQAAYGSVDSPFCGGRTAGPKPSDMALLKGLGLS